jgi:hypothetical protein
MKGLLFLCACLLFVGLLNMPIGFYTFLRIIVTIGAIAVLIKEFEKGLNFWILVFVVIIIIFNPLVPIYLNNKSAWVPIDIICGLLFLLKSYTQNQK